MAGSQRSVEERNDERRNHSDDLFEDRRRYRIGCRNLSGSRRTALMTSSVASGEKARNATSDRAQRNIVGGEPLVLDCTLATF